MNPKQYYTFNRDLRHGQPVPEPHEAVGNGHRPIPLFGHETYPQVALSLVQRYCRPRKCLDVGCGDLSFLRMCLSLGAECHGVDIVSFPAWKRYREISTTRVDLNEELLPFPQETFSVVSMLAVLEHVFDPFQAIEEVGRVLQPGGHLVVAVPNISYLRISLPLIFGRFPITSSRSTWERRAWDGYHLHNFTRERLEWLVTEFAGLKPMTCKGSGRFWKLRSLCPSVLTGDLILLAQKPGN